MLGSTVLPALVAVGLGIAGAGLAAKVHAASQPCVPNRGCGACNPCAARRGCNPCGGCNPYGGAPDVELLIAEAASTFDCLIDKMKAAYSKSKNSSAKNFTRFRL